ncbi:unnamed protein product [Leptidea sinapis]|uniref:Uncharacterized protein n=1 Tax=Leptidea sinapis TaxID=189913 RepID=A0A5E4Q149_9NEOP|nr:unnamed protein product [Leptidea sinapis]
MEEEDTDPSSLHQVCFDYLDVIGDISCWPYLYSRMKSSQSAMEPQMETCVTHVQEWVASPAFRHTVVTTRRAWQELVLIFCKGHDNEEKKKLFLRPSLTNVELKLKQGGTYLTPDKRICMYNCKYDCHRVHEVAEHEVAAVAGAAPQYMVRGHQHRQPEQQNRVQQRVHGPHPEHAHVEQQPLLRRHVQHRITNPYHDLRRADLVEETDSEGRQGEKDHYQRFRATWHRDGKVQISYAIISASGRPELGCTPPGYCITATPEDTPLKYFLVSVYCEYIVITHIEAVFVEDKQRLRGMNKPR